MAKRADFVEMRREKRRKQIFDGGVKVFAEKGFHSATTQEIADAAGLAKGTLYEYVKDKEDILLLIIEETIQLLTSEIHKVISENEDPEARLKCAIQVHLSFATKFRDAAMVMRNQIITLSDAGRIRASASLDNLIETFRSVIDYGIQAGRFKEFDLRIAAELFLQTCTVYFDYGSLPHQKLSLDDFTLFITDNFVNSVLKPENEKCC